MELRQVRSFLSIAETLHFGRTAELIHISQPAFRYELLRRRSAFDSRAEPTQTTLTAAGLAFRDDAAAELSQLEQAIRRARLAASGKLRLLRIGFVLTAGVSLWPISFYSLESYIPRYSALCAIFSRRSRYRCRRLGRSILDFFVYQLACSGPSMSSSCIGNRSYSWCHRRINWQKGKGCAYVKSPARTS